MSLRRAGRAGARALRVLVEDAEEEPGEAQTIARPFRAAAEQAVDGHREREQTASPSAHTTTASSRRSGSAILVAGSFRARAHQHELRGADRGRRARATRCPTRPRAGRARSTARAGCRAELEERRREHARQRAPTVLLVRLGTTATTVGSELLHVAARSLRIRCLDEDARTGPSFVSIVPSGVAEAAAGRRSGRRRASGAELLERPARGRGRG